MKSERIEQILLNKGNSLSNLKRFEEALECYEESLKLNRNDSKIKNL